MGWSWRKVKWLKRGLFLALLLVTLTAFGCRRENTALTGLNTTITVWGLWQESEMMKPAIDAFRLQTGAKVEYKKIAAVADYERTLLSALAEGKGPDVFVIHNTWVESKSGIMKPAPGEVVTVKNVQEEFVDVVNEDLVREGGVYALPTSVDTLALFYNRDLLNAAGVARPPQTWQDMLTIVPRLTEVNRIGTITKSAIAIGTADNINRAGDVLQLLMLQSESEQAKLLRTGTGPVTLNNAAGETALRFYTDFANRAKQSYTWNLEQDYSLDAFAEGETAMMINYSYHIPTIEAKNPRLRIGIANVPQVADTPPINLAAYWPFAVSNTSPAPELAWQFVRTLTSPEVAAKINEAQRAPAAHKAAIEAQASDPLLGTFARQALLATTWPRPDINAADSIFHAMIDSVVAGEATIKDALQAAQDQLNQLGKARQEPVFF
jgi:multiple sugar transport system substrate-binding protein